MYNNNNVNPAGLIDAEVACDMTSDRVARLDNGSDIMHISEPPYTCDPSPLRYSLNHNIDIDLWINISVNLYLYECDFKICSFIK